jgi:HSP20 family protein
VLKVISRFKSSRVNKKLRKIKGGISMNIVLRNGETRVPFYRPLTTFDVMEELSREIWDSWRPVDLNDRILPKTDMYEEKGQLVMKTELPGISKEDLEVSLEGNTLMIKGEKKEKNKKGSKKTGTEHYHEQYYHSIALPYPVDQEKVTATYNKGVLELRLPKGEEVKPKKIEIKAQLPKGESKKPELKPEQK